MATITQMRRVFVHDTGLFVYTVPYEFREEFYKLLDRFNVLKTEESKQTFLDRFECYRVKTHQLPTLELYVVAKGYYDKRNEGLNEPNTTA